MIFLSFFKKGISVAIKGGGWGLTLKETGGGFRF